MCCAFNSITGMWYRPMTNSLIGGFENLIRFPIVSPSELFIAAPPGKHSCKYWLNYGRVYCTEKVLFCQLAFMSKPTAEKAQRVPPRTVPGFAPLAFRFRLTAARLSPAVQHHRPFILPVRVRLPRTGKARNAAISPDVPPD